MFAPAGTNVAADSLPDSPSSKLTARMGSMPAPSSLATSPMALASCFLAFGMSTRHTAHGAPAAVASAMAAFSLPAAASFMPAACFFWNAFTVFSSASTSARSDALVAAEMTAVSIFLFSVGMTRSRSRSSGFMERASDTSPASCSASSYARMAALRVSAVARRMPFARALSSTSTNFMALAVLEMCVPPQSSTDMPPHAALSGSAASVATSSPTHTTRTGSG